MRRVLLVLLGFGVFAGYGSAIASARWHHRQHGGGGCESRWSRNYERPPANFAPVAVAAPTPAPVAAPAPAAALPAQQIIVIMPGGQGAAAAPQVITVPVPAQAPAPATP